MRRNWLMYVLTFSLALNGATVAGFFFFWWQSRSLAALSDGQKSIKSFVQEDLRLSSEQSSRILSQIDRSKQEAAALRALMDAERAEMISLITATPVNKDAVAGKIDELNRIQGKIRSAAVATVVTILESLPEDSRSRFRAYLRTGGRACDTCIPPAPGVSKGILPR